MDATYTTSLRTGAAGGVAAKYLARKNSRVFGFIGCGTQAYFQLEALRRVFNIEEVKVYDVRKNAADKFVEYCRKEGIAASLQPAEEASRCDVLVTTTPSRKPVVKAEWLMKERT